MDKFPCVLRLLQPANDLTPPDSQFIELCGSRWVLNEYANPSLAPAYTCISYVWEQEKTANRLDTNQKISARTIPAIEAVIKAAQSPERWSNVQLSRDQEVDARAKTDAAIAAHVLWIDAICTPPKEAARVSTLRSMGAIYSSAWQVFAVLSASTAVAFRQIHETGRLDLDALLFIENDDWINRAWTYQEIVNSRSLYFIVQGDEREIVSGLDFLNAVLTAADDYQRIHKIDSLTWNQQHPKLFILESLIADYRVAEYGGRSAYQVMSAMHQRTAERGEDHFYAMIGAVGTAASSGPDDEPQSPSEYFMRACEAKGDFSFIYNTAPRSEANGRRWRPIEGKFQPVLPEPLIFGSGQSGRIKPTHIQLENMCRPVPGNIESEGLNASIAYLKMVHRHRPSGHACSCSSEVAEALLKILVARGFSGCGEYLELDRGYFFPQSSIQERAHNIFVAISTDVHWHGGSPGLLLHSNGTSVSDFCDVGVFVGRIPKTGESVCVG